MITLTSLLKSLGERQQTYFKFVVVFLLFLLLVFDRDLGMIYLLILFGDFIWYLTDKNISFPLIRKTTSFRDVLETVVAVGVFLGISTVLVDFLSPNLISNGIISGAQSIFQLLATGTPILSGNKFFTLLGWGVMVPIIETSFFFGRLLEGMTTILEKTFGVKISYKKISVPLIIAIFIVASLFTLFHITAKGLSTIPLMVTFIFAIISCALVIRNGELKNAVALHIIVNSFAVMSSFGWL